MKNALLILAAILLVNAAIYHLDPMAGVLCFLLVTVWHIFYVVHLAFRLFK